MTDDGAKFPERDVEEIRRLHSQIESLEQLLGIQESTAIDQALQLEGAVDQLTAYSQQLESVGRISRALSGELDRDTLLQTITDAATGVVAATFGGLFYKVSASVGPDYLLHTLSGVTRDDAERLSALVTLMLFESIFRGETSIRVDDIAHESTDGRTQLYSGLQKAGIGVVSFMAVPVISRSGAIAGGLFFGHPERAHFTPRHEQAIVDIAAQAAIAVDNARLYAEVAEKRDAAERNEKRYKSIVFASPTAQAVLLTNAAGELVDESASWGAITGQQQAQMRGRGWLDALHPDDRKLVSESWDRALATGTMFDQEFRVRVVAGSFRWFRGKGVPVYGPNAQISEWISTLTDVDETRQADESLKFLEQANQLFAASLEYEATLNTLAKIAVPRVADWCLVDIAEGDGYARMAIAHSDPEKVDIARKHRECYPTKPDKDPVLAVIRSGVPMQVKNLGERMLREPGQNDECVEMIRSLGFSAAMIVPLRSRNRNVGAVSFISEDPKHEFSRFEMAQAGELARRAELAIENALLYGSAQDANRAKDTFLATLSHELRTPMTAILGWSQLLSVGLSEDEMQEAILAIQQSAKAQAHIIDDILDVSRVVTGKLQIASLPVRMREIVSKAMLAARPSALARTIALVEEFEGEGLVLGDAGRLQQIVWNLLSNAIKFTRKGGTVTIRVEHEGSVVRVAVADTGKGINRAFLSHVFEPFRQEESSTTREHGGLGLGLAIVRYLVELHGGRISVTSEGEGRGSQFTFELPLFEGDVWADESGSRKADFVADPDEVFPQLPAVRVLVVDDQPFTRDFVRAAMRHCGAVTTSAASVTEAMLALKEGTFDVVLCDIAMPDQDGFALLEQMKRDAKLASIPTVAVTAFGRPEDRTRILEAGFDVYVKKPVEPQALAFAVVDALDRVKADRRR